MWKWLFSVISWLSASYWMKTNHALFRFQRLQQQGTFLDTQSNPCHTSHPKSTWSGSSQLLSCQQYILLFISCLVMGVLLHYHKMDQDKIRYLKSNMLTASITVRMWSSVRSIHCCWEKWCERVQALYKTIFKKRKKKRKDLIQSYHIVWQPSYSWGLLKWV